MSQPDYLLGHHHLEWSRLEEQHLLWRHTILQTLKELGLSAGHHCLEIGCGTGALLQDLADRVGPTGLAIGMEQDANGIRVSAERCRPLSQVHVLQRDVLTDELDGPYDFIVARWVFSFFPDVSDAVTRLKAALKPGGCLVVQDYNHDGFRIFPGCDGFERVVEAYRSAYRAIGGDLWVGARLPAYLADARMETVQIEPHIMAGGPDTPVFRWVSRFLLEHLSTVVRDGHLSEEDAENFRQSWTQIQSRPDTVLFSPIQVTVVGRRLDTESLHDR